MFEVIEEKIAVPLMLVITALVLGGIFLQVREADDDFNAVNQAPPIVKSEKKDSAANWQTYRNEEFGFEVKYPEEFRFCLNDFCEDDAENFYHATVTESSKELTENNLFLPHFFRVRAYKNIETINLDELSAKDLARTNQNHNEQAGNFISGSDEEIIFSDFTAYKFDVDGGVKDMGWDQMLDGKYRVIIFDRKGTIFGILHALTPEFEQILSTFKFIDPVDTSSWQTYRNEEFGFEFKYPDNTKLENATIEKGRGYLYLYFSQDVVSQEHPYEHIVVEAKPENETDKLQCEKYLNNKQVGFYIDEGEGAYEILLIDGLRACSQYVWHGPEGSSTSKEVVFIKDGMRFNLSTTLFSDLPREVVRGLSDEVILNLKANSGDLSLDDRKKVEYFNQILSTFKFTE